MKKEDSDNDWGWWCGGACTRGKMYLVPKGKGACPRNSRWRQLGPGGWGCRSAHAWKCAVPSFVRAQLKHDHGTKSGRGHVAELQNSKFFRQGREEAPWGPETRQTLDLDRKRTKTRASSSSEERERRQRSLPATLVS